MREFPVNITEKAKNDLDAIYEYIAVDLQSPKAAIRQYCRLADRILQLGFFPERYRLVDFEPERSQGLRRVLVGNYSIFYVFKEEVVSIIRVLYSASDIENRLKEDY